MIPYNLLIFVISIYLLGINIIAFVLMGLDKRRAIKKQWRIQERTLFLTAILGGSIGSIAGMQIFRHKTKHSTFIYGMPFILIVHILLFGWLAWQSL